MDTPLLLNGAAEESSSFLEEHGGDYTEVKGFQQARKVFAIETVRIWKIALPIVFNILCQYGVNSITNIFVGHLGDIELSAVSLINSVIGTFAFGFMVCFLFSLSLSLPFKLISIFLL
jgi:MATE family multidrug resistance protein